jgi:hypothetical protein
MTQAGGTSATLQASDLSNSSTLNFCQLTFEPVFVPYSVKNPFVMNYNSVMKNGTLYPDSDADGKADNLDSTPVTRRTASTKNLFEGICNILPANACANFDTSTCDGTVVDLFGFTACDRKVMNLKVSGDSDIYYDINQIEHTIADGMPDLAEILKGGLPLTKDDDYNAGDSLTNLQKLRKGRQLRFFEQNIDPKTEVNATFARQYINSVCPSGTEEYKISIYNLPLVQTQAYSSSNPTENVYFGHGKDENLYNVYFYAQSSNPALAPTQLYGLKPSVIQSKMKIKFGQSGIINLDPSDFTLYSTLEEH